MEQERGQIRLRWIISCGTCGDAQEFYGLNESGSKLARRAGWQYTLARGYCCPSCSAVASEVASAVASAVASEVASEVASAMNYEVIAEAA